MSDWKDWTVPATFTVTNAGDAGAGSLRQAITDANAAAGADAVAFDPGFFASPQTISLLTAFPNISGDLSVSGTGAINLTVQRDPSASAFRVFTVDNAAGTAIEVTLSALTVNNGNLTTGNGAGIFVANERVTLDRREGHK